MVKLKSLILEMLNFHGVTVEYVNTYISIFIIVNDVKKQLKRKQLEKKKGRESLKAAFSELNHCQMWWCSRESKTKQVVLYDLVCITAMLSFSLFQ